MILEGSRLGESQIPGQPFWHYLGGKSNRELSWSKRETISLKRLLPMTLSRVITGSETWGHILCPIPVSRRFFLTELKCVSCTCQVRPGPSCLGTSCTFTRQVVLV